MNRKLSSIKRVISGMKPFISPYKWQLMGALFMASCQCCDNGGSP